MADPHIRPNRMEKGHPVTMAEQVVVRKHNYRGEFVASWQGEVVERASDYVLLRATWTRRPTSVDRLVFEPGDVFLEYYYPRQPYSIWSVYTSDGLTLKGWYCNISLPLDITVTTFDVHDLVLDVLVYPDGSHTILDEDELAEACQDGLPDDLAALARAAVRQVVALVDEHAPPFDVIKP